MTMPVLPQKDPNADARTAALDGMRGQFEWDHAYLPPLALLKMPGSTRATTWRALLGWVNELPELAHPDAKYIEGRGASLLPLGKPDRGTRAVEKEQRFASLDGFAEIFGVLPRPRVVGTWKDDAEFAYQRLGGPSPSVIRRIAALPSDLALAEDRVAGLLGDGATLAGELKAGRVYLCDLAILEGIPGVSDAAGARYTMPTRSLFHLRGGALRPIAIQLGLDPRPDAVYTPNDGKAWLIAKVCAQSADVNYHEMGPHLLRTHFLEETVAVAAARRLAPSHPISALLWPHFEILLFNNFEGRELLINPGGKVDQTLGGGAPIAKIIIERDLNGYPERGISPFSFDDWDLPRSVAARGMTDVPDYPYRDDGMLIWKAIRRFVSEYLSIYYAADSDVVADWEVQGFAQELSSPRGGGLRGAPASFETRDQLADALTRILFAAGPEHAAVNFAQYEYMAFAPNMPLSLYAPIPADVRTLDDAALDDLLLRVLPPPSKAVLQRDTIFELTSFRYLRLGQYPEGAIEDPAALRAIAAFQADLEAAEAEIAKRNADRQKRGLPQYLYFTPSLIPVSTSI